MHRDLGFEHINGLFQNSLKSILQNFQQKREKHSDCENFEIYFILNIGVDSHVHMSTVAYVSYEIVRCQLSILYLFS